MLGGKALEDVPKNQGKGDDKRGTAQLEVKKLPSWEGAREQAVVLGSKLSVLARLPADRREALALR
jgi:hypothetical protein